MIRRFSGRTLHAAVLLNGLGLHRRNGPRRLKVSSLLEETGVVLLVEAGSELEISRMKARMEKESSEKLVRGEIVQAATVTVD